MSYELEDIQYEDYSELEELIFEEVVPNTSLDKANYYCSNNFQTPISIKISNQDEFDNSDFIGIPFVKSQIDEIIDIYTITQVNDQLKKVYKVNTNCVAIIDTAWMKTITDQVKQGLGINMDENVDYKFDKMYISTDQICSNEEMNEYKYKNVNDDYLYEKKKKEKQNQDDDDEYSDSDEEEDDDDDEFDPEFIFSKVIITLPSRHQGGEIIVSNHNNSKHLTHKTNIKYKSAQEINYIAFYNDCKYNIGSVESGNHIYLIYNLYKTSMSSVYTSSELEKKKNESKNNETQLPKKLMNTLMGCNGLDGGKQFLVYVFENDYKDLKFTNLVYRDKVVANKLLKLSLKHNSFRLYLGKLEIFRDSEGGYEDGYEYSSYTGKGSDGTYEYDKTFQFTIEFDGGLKINWLHDFSPFFPDECLDGLEPYSIKKSGIKHGGSGYAKIRYSKHVLLIIRSK